jgi:hypothetical protein
MVEKEGIDHQSIEELISPDTTTMTMIPSSGPVVVRVVTIEQPKPPSCVSRKIRKWHSGPSSYAPYGICHEQIEGYCCWKPRFRRILRDVEAIANHDRGYGETASTNSRNYEKKEAYVFATTVFISTPSPSAYRV